MVAPFETSVICPVLIGREMQLAALNHLIMQASGGQGQAALIAGEAGVGKSRLVAEAKASATRQGFAVLKGRCFEPDRVLPYAPLCDLLRLYLTAPPLDTIAQALGPMAPQLVGLLPEFATLLPDVVPALALDAEQERRRIIQAFVQFFTYCPAIQGAHKGALLLVVEDLHWSDEASLDVLLTLARRIAAQPILLLLTCRSDEIQPGLAAMLAALERERLTGEMHLARLDYDEVDAMLRAIFGQRRPIRGDFLSTFIHLLKATRSLEVLKALIATGDIFYAHGQWDRKPLSDLNIPRTVQIAVRRRVDLLSSDARRLLALAVVAGRRFDFDLLKRLTSHDEPRLLELIKPLIMAQQPSAPRAGRGGLRDSPRDYRGAWVSRTGSRSARRISAQRPRYAAPTSRAHAPSQG